MTKPELVQQLRLMASRIQSFSYSEPEVIKEVEDLLNQMKFEYKKD